MQHYIKTQNDLVCSESGSKSCSTCFTRRAAQEKKLNRNVQIEENIIVVTKTWTHPSSSVKRIVNNVVRKLFEGVI